MKKRVFWKTPSESVVNGTPCPFIGVTISTYEEFVQLLQERLFHPVEKGSHKGHYPPYIFSTKLNDTKILFSGTTTVLKDAPINPKNNKPYKWAIFNTDIGKITRFLSIQNDWPTIFNLFDDDEQIQRKINTLDAIVKRDGGLTIKVGN